MPKNEKETKVKRILIIAGAAAVACVVVFLGISHQRGKSDNDGRQLLSWNEETSLSSEQKGDFFAQKETEAQSGKTYLGLESLREMLGEKKYQTFKNEFDTYLVSSGAPECETVALAWPEIESDDETISCYLQTDDEANSLYQFIYRYADESYSFITVDALPFGDVNPENPVQSELQNQNPVQSELQNQNPVQSELQNQKQDAADSKTAQETGQNSSAASGSDTSASQSSAGSGTSNKYHTVNGVQFENMAIYETLSEKAVDLFTKDVTNHWSETGEDRRLISTTTPEKNGSKVTFTCTFPDGRDSFRVTLDLNTESFTYE